MLPDLRVRARRSSASAAPSFKCPPAPSEAALLLDEFLRERGVRDDVRIQVVMPFGTPIPPSPETSDAILATFAERGIEFVPGRRGRGARPDHARGRARRRQRVCPTTCSSASRCTARPSVVERPASRRTAGSRWTRDARDALPGRLRGGRRHERRHAEGGRVRRGRRARGRRSADRADPRRDRAPRLRRHRRVLDRVRRSSEVARVDVDFFSTPGHPTGMFTPPSLETAAEKSRVRVEPRAPAGSAPESVIVRTPLMRAA